MSNEGGKSCLLYAGILRGNNSHRRTVSFRYVSTMQIGNKATNKRSLKQPTCSCVFRYNAKEAT